MRVEKRFDVSSQKYQTWSDHEVHSDSFYSSMRFDEGAAHWQGRSSDIQKFCARLRWQLPRAP